MNDQLDLLGMESTSPTFKPEKVLDPGGRLRGYSLFLAIFPEPLDARRIAAASASLCDHHALRSQPIQSERLHITLHTLAHFKNTLPQTVIDAAKAAASSVTCPPLALVFDRALSFAGNGAVVLRCNDPSEAAIARLRESLTVALRRAGLDPDPSRTPHMTLLYDRRQVAEHSIPPIDWRATRFSLIVSHVGLTHHQRLAEWRVTGRH